MAKDPAFLFYPNDFTSGTQFFSDEQVGKYMRILMAQHQHGHLTENQVIFICKSYDKDIFSKLIKDSFGLWYNKRLEEEIIKRKNYVESRSKNKEGKTKEKIISKSYENHMVNENENRDINKKEREPEEEIEICPTFENFWDEYDKKVGDKEKIKKKWVSLKQIEREEIMEYIPKYKISKPNKQYRKDPQTFLNNKSWHDELIDSNERQKSNPATDHAQRWVNYIADKAR